MIAWFDKLTMSGFMTPLTQSRPLHPLMVSLSIVTVTDPLARPLHPLMVSLSNHRWLG